MTDCHGQFQHFSNLHYKYNPEETAIIILGDVGFNYYGENSKKDLVLKQQAEQTGFTFYCVRGNHEFRPQHLSSIILEFDENVHGKVYYEPAFPLLRYFKDFGIYTIGKWKTGIIGGAYSVDKEYRLMKGWHWFSDEQLTDIEMNTCYNKFKCNHFDLILTHTCPYDWRPTDLFLSSIDQSKVDNSMEKFLQIISENIKWKNWFWGHYHENRIYPPIKKNQNRIMFFDDVVKLEEIVI